MSINKFDVNQPVDARRLDRLAESLSSFDFSVAPPLELRSGPTGTSLALRTPEPFYALLSGTTSPYSWTEVKPLSDGTWEDGFRSGTSNAYEVNNKASLDGNRVKLFPGFLDYRFEFDKECCGHPTPTGCSVFCVHVVGQDGQDPSGLPVEITGTLSGDPWSTSGTMDSDGSFCYTLPTTGAIPHVTGASITACGHTYAAGFSGGSSGTCNTLTFRYCNASVVVTINPSANPSVILAPYYATGVVSGSTVTFDFCYFSPFPASFPQTFTITATSYNEDGSQNYLFPYLCKTITLDCGSTYDVDMVQVDCSACYFGESISANCDLGCNWGPGPSYRGLIPKNVQLTWTSGPASTVKLFADDEGVSVTLAGSLTYDEFGHVNGVLYDTGCRSAMGNFTGFTGTCGDSGTCQLNNTPYSGHAIPFQGTEMILTQNDLQYRRASQPGCAVPPDRCHHPGCSYDGNFGCGCCCEWDSITGFLCGDCTTGAFAEFAFNGNPTLINPVDGTSNFEFQRFLLCSPCDWVAGFDSGGSLWFAPADLAHIFMGPTTVWSCTIVETC